ncbi:helix-turn-helix domain-containing protein [Neobacillus citreus]|uniref:Helix-turn-helix transcriptional regulator n=1 Tax=Neobacillus citreus TaxID=2833578 RepID=A0A942T1W4_9BACI
MIGEKIRELREKKNLSISELAERAGVAKSYLSLIERNNYSNPSIHYLTKICKVLDVSLNDLINFEENINQGN